jgi:hypothetical protein
MTLRRSFAGRSIAIGERRDDAARRADITDPPSRGVASLERAGKQPFFFADIWRPWTRGARPAADAGRCAALRK